MLPIELKELILDYHASIEEYEKRTDVHNELFLYFREILRTRLNEEFSFIFYPGFYEDLEIPDYNGAVHVIHVTHYATMM